MGAESFSVRMDGDVGMEPLSPLFTPNMSKSTPYNSKHEDMTIEEMYYHILQAGYQPNVPQFQINSHNWKAITYACVLVATKYWEDKYFWNIDVVNKLKIYGIKETNRFENLIMSLTQFELSVSK